MRILENKYNSNNFRQCSCKEIPGALSLQRESMQIKQAEVKYKSFLLLY